MATEKRLIGLDDLMKFPIRIDHYDRENGNEHFVLGIESVLEYAENLPTVDAVEVVRCKDCAKSVPHEIFPHSRRCKVEDCRLSHKETHYCSYGERRTE